MPKWYEAANAASFRPVADGYVFQSPNPWMFARPRYFLVSEAQKTQIAAHMGCWRRLLLASLLTIFILMGAFIAFVQLSPATFLRLAAPISQFGTGVFALILFALLMLLMAPLIAIPQIYLVRGLRRLLANAPRTSERIAVGDQVSTIAGSVSVRMLVLGLVGGICLLGSAVLFLIEAYAEGHLLRGLFLFFLPLFIFGGLLTWYFVYLLRLRAKLKRAHGHF
jgi:hypothetical protein